MPESGIDEFRYVSTTRTRVQRQDNTLFDLRDPDSDYVFVMNPDVYVCPDALSELLSPFGARG